MEKVVCKRPLILHMRFEALESILHRMGVFCLVGFLTIQFVHGEGESADSILKGSLVVSVES